MMDYMGSHDLFDHLLAPRKNQHQQTEEARPSLIRRLLSLRRPSQARNRRKSDPQTNCGDTRAM